MSEVMMEHQAITEQAITEQAITDQALTDQALTDQAISDEQEDSPDDTLDPAYISVTDHDPTVIPSVEHCYMKESGRTIRIIRRYRLQNVTPSLAKLIQTPPDVDFGREISEKINARFRFRYHTDEAFRLRRKHLDRVRRDKAKEEGTYNPHPHGRRSLTSQEKEIRKQMLRERYKTDPAYREKIRHRAREAYVKTKAATADRERNKYANDEYYAEKKKVAQRKRYQENPLYAEKCRQHARDRYQMKKQDVNSILGSMPMSPDRVPPVATVLGNNPTLIQHGSQVIVSNDSPYLLTTVQEEHPELGEGMTIEYAPATSDLTQANIISSLTNKQYQFEHVHNFNDGVPGQIPSNPETVMVETPGGVEDLKESQDLVYVCPMEGCSLEMTSLHELQTHFTEKHPDVMVMFKT